MGCQTGWTSRDVLRAPGTGPAETKGNQAWGCPRGPGPAAEAMPLSLPQKAPQGVGFCLAHPGQFHVPLWEMVICIIDER